MNPWSRLAYGVAAFALLAGTVSAQQPMPECAVSHNVLEALRKLTRSR